MAKKLNKKLDLRQLREHFRVAIYGSARIEKNDPRYKLIHTLSKMIAQENMDLVTGGGPGLMDAASRGHHAGRKKGNHALSFGLTIHLPREQRESYHLDIKKEFTKFSNRLDHFVALSNVVIVAPGGIGTLLELMYTWQLVQVKHASKIPIILLGDMWEGLIEWIKTVPLRNRFLKKEDLNLLFPAKNATEAMKIIRVANKEYKKNDNGLIKRLQRYNIT
ncbi:LOG family protein [Candidatus Woesearchaeota archaeon]|nr:LOG family protein [Candidatus Woesearchaeota archaeon]